MSHVINSRAFTGEKPCINKAIHALLMQLLICSYRGHRFAAVTSCVLPGPRTSIVRGNCIRETSVKRRNKIVQEITRNIANVFSFYAIIAIGHGFPMHPASVFITSLGTWRILMHEKPCLIPIMKLLGRAPSTKNILPSALKEEEMCRR